MSLTLNEEKIYENFLDKFKEFSETTIEIKEQRKKDNDQIKDLILKLSKKSSFGFYAFLAGLFLQILVGLSSLYNAHLDREEKHIIETEKINHEQKLEIEKQKKDRYIALDKLVQLQGKDYKLVDSLLNDIEFNLTNSDPKEKDYDTQFQKQIINLISLQSDWIVDFGGNIIPEIHKYTSVINEIELKILNSRRNTNPKYYLSNLRAAKNKLEDAFKDYITGTKKERDKYFNLDSDIYEKKQISNYNLSQISGQ